jgi:O-antigen/teichoic acid export membrane protein
MKIQEHITKISWSFADKSLYLIYGFIAFFQIRAMEPDEYGIFAILINIYSWIIAVSESLSVQMVIQFGAIPSNRPKVNLIGLLLFIITALGITLIFFLFQNQIVHIFNEPRLHRIAFILPILTALTIPRILSMKLIFRDRLFRRLFLVDLAYFGTMGIITFMKIITNKNLYFEDMVFIYSSGAIISSVIGLILVRKELVFGKKGDVGLKQLLKISVPLTLYNSINNMPKYLDIMLVQFFFSTATAGVYQFAKNLYKFFDEANNTAGSLIYATSFRLINIKDNKGLNDLITKAVSFVFIGFLVIVLFFESGFSRFIITTFLNLKYFNSISQLNLLIISAVFLPFTFLSAIITASGKPGIVLKYVVIGITGWFITFYIVGISGIPGLIPLAQIVYTLIYGILCFNYSMKHFGFRPLQIFRALGDTISFIKNRKL